jgi:DNA-binding HxlR family transcriptional regulator
MCRLTGRPRTLACCTRPRVSTIPGMGEVAVAVAVEPQREACCSLYHQAIELVGKRWTGAIVAVLLEGPARFSEIKECVPDLSDRLLSERLKELEAEGLVDRQVIDGNPPRVQYLLTEKGLALEPALHSLRAWARTWLDS